MTVDIEGVFDLIFDAGYRRDDCKSVIAVIQAAEWIAEFDTTSQLDDLRNALNALPQTEEPRPTATHTLE